MLAKCLHDAVWLRNRSWRLVLAHDGVAEEAGSATPEHVEVDRLLVGYPSSQRVANIEPMASNLVRVPQLGVNVPSGNYSYAGGRGR